ncbi:hypothetical protein BD769DRAFT_1658754 [Suillus cothurnatus]|nr:hypothetical protein BD769DRAFT_1658754 [Suillus cothurnatus]
MEDGGDIEYRGFSDDGLGKSGIERMLMHYIPEVKGILDEEEAIALDEFSKLEEQLAKNDRIKIPTELLMASVVD